MQEITTFKQLCEWLYENDYFSHGHVLSIDYDPLSITIGETIKGNWKAHTEKHILSYTLAPKNLLEWSIPNGFIPTDENFIEGFEAIEMDGGVALKSSSEDITIIAKSFIISDPEIIVTTFKPWLSFEELSVMIPLEDVPQPLFWKQRFHELGYDVSFRYFKGEAKPIEQIPYPDYSGYFIQHSDRISHTDMGLVINCVSKVDGKSYLSFSKKEKNCDDLWMALTAVLAEMSDAEIKCGNCTFTSNEWKQLLGDKKYVGSHCSGGIVPLEIWQIPK